MSAEFVSLAGFQFLVDRHTVVEDKTFPLEKTIRVLFEVIENSTFKLVDFFKALLLHGEHGFFTANSARAIN